VADVPFGGLQSASQFAQSYAALLPAECQGVVVRRTAAGYTVSLPVVP
jgi:hypothetical protein